MCGGMPRRFHCCSAYPVAHASAVSKPFGRYEVDSQAERVPTLAGPGVRRSCVRDKVTKEYVPLKAVPGHPADCACKPDDNCQHLHYWHVGLKRDDKLRDGKYPFVHLVPYGRLLKTVLEGKPDGVADADMSAWVLHHESAAVWTRLPGKGTKRRVADDSGTGETAWVLKGEHTAAHNRKGAKRRRTAAS